MKGIILKNQNGYFSIAGEGEQLTLCRSRGRLKRKTIRTPDLSLGILDKMILMAENEDIEPLLVINKCDLARDTAKEVQALYEKAGYSCILTSLVTGEGLETLKAAFQGPIIAFSGPSGVGKSSLLNHFLNCTHFEAGAVSRHTGRGRTTTRHAELVRTEKGHFLMDTPGYTLLDVLHVKADDLAYLYREFRPFLGKCRFRDCMHAKEPDCAVRDAVTHGDIQEKRYLSYLHLLEEIKESEARRFL